MEKNGFHSVSIAAVYVLDKAINERFDVHFFANVS